MPVGDRALASPDSVGTDSDRWVALRLIAIRRAYAFASRSPQGAVFSHLTAAHLHGLPVPHRLFADLSVHVTLGSREARPQAVGVTAHFVRSGRQRTVALGGMEVSTAVDTWCELSSMLHLNELVIVGDALVRRKDPLATMEDLAFRVRAYSGRHGVRRLRAALELVRPNTDSVPETELRLAIVDAGLPEPEVNVWVVDRQGRRLRLGDLVDRKRRILLEYDGPHHFQDEGQRRKDIDVLDAAVADGWRVIRAHRGHRANGFLEITARLRAALQERGWPSN
ncbi:MAG: hypothetical protein VB093_09140 [Propionicimonas sp.]|nr:hypothetical protein [Propionicimonas sp.]